MWKGVQSDVMKSIIKWLVSLLIVLGIMFFLFHVVIMNMYVPSASMYPTLQVKGRYISNRLAYIKDDPDRYDIVVFRYPDDESEHYVKRIIGLPGETIEVKDGSVYADGVKLDDSFVSSPTMGEGTYQVPKGCYFMMGDNRAYSNDSRMWTHKYVERDKIEAKVISQYYPTFKNVK